MNRITTFVANNAKNMLKCSAAAYLGFGCVVQYKFYENRPRFCDEITQQILKNRIIYEKNPGDLRSDEIKIIKSYDEFKTESSLKAQVHKELNDAMRFMFIAWPLHIRVEYK